MLIPSRCPVCARQGPAPCAGCVRSLRPAPLLAPPPGLDALVAALVYEGDGRRLLTRMKYGNERAVLGWLAICMSPLVPAAVDLVTWAPTGAARRRQRGFDQAELLARAVGRRLGRPCRPTLTRLPGPAQTGRTLEQRRSAPRFCPSPGSSAFGRVLLVDDVVTTGATLTAAAEALRAAGASSVIGLAAAHTPSQAEGSETRSEERERC